MRQEDLLAKKAWALEDSQVRHARELREHGERIYRLFRDPIRHETRVRYPSFHTTFGTVFWVQNEMGKRTLDGVGALQVGVGFSCMNRCVSRLSDLENRAARAILAILDNIRA